MKTIKISDELHRKIKVFCAENDLKINEWVEKELQSVILNHVYEFDTNENRLKMEGEIENKLK